MPLAFLILFFIALVGFVAGRRRLRQIHRQEVRAEPFPDTWRAILKRNMKLYARLPPALREELHGHLQVFLAEKHFEGCGGLELTDEMRVTIAAQACLLLLNRRVDPYPKLGSILVYPGAYRPRRMAGPGLRHEPMDTVRLGESSSRGAVVLAWEAVQPDPEGSAEPRNLVLHEFAHQLDQEDGVADGAPLLERPASYSTWAQVLSREYAALKERAESGEPTLLDAYGATNPAEFFAVATETFFEKPLEMRREHPELYEELRGYYNLDPAEWMEGAP